MFAPLGAVDMAHENHHVVLVIRIEGLSLRDYISDKLMVLLDMWLLPGSLRITIEDLRSMHTVPGLLQIPYPLELAAVVSQNGWDNVRKVSIPNALVSQSKTSTTESAVPSGMMNSIIRSFCVKIMVSIRFPFSRTPFTVSIST